MFNPSRHLFLSGLIKEFGREGPEAFIIQALDIFEYALREGDGKIVVEVDGFWKRLFGKAKRYVFNIRGRTSRLPT